MYSSMRRSVLVTAAIASFIVGQGGPVRLVIAAQSPAGTTRFEIMKGSRASFRVREQLAGVDFLNDAVGVTETVEGALLVRPDGTVDASQSRLTVDVRAFASDQDRRDNFLRKNVLETEKFPQAVFVPRTLVGSPWPVADAKTPFPIVGFQLLGDMTLHGVTKPITWKVVATHNTAKGMVEGKAMTNFPFSTFSLTKPTFAFLLSVEDDIRLEIDFKMMSAAAPKNASGQ